MVDAGLFRMCVPGELGGLEVDPTTLMAAIEEVAAADAATGWCLMICATTGVNAALLEEPGRPRAATISSP